MINIHTDGGSRGNPGPAAAAFLILNESNKPLHTGKKYLGINTNNYAEYSALLMALSTALEKKLAGPYKVFMDSELVVKQLTGLYKIKNIALKQLAIKIKALEDKVDGGVIYTHVRREKNVEADAIVNDVLDENL